MPGRRKHFHEPKFFCNEKKRYRRETPADSERPGQEDLLQRTGPQHTKGFQPPTKHAEQWTVDPF